MPKRVLWLINNPNIRDFEAKMLIKNGYEVFMPKSVRWECGLTNASVTYEYDRTLSLNEDELALLNGTDFYKDVSDEVAEVMNKHFDMAFVLYYPEQLKMLVKRFTGGIILRALGRKDEYTYTEQITEDLGYGFHQRIKKIIGRFWFTEAYPGLANREGDYLRRKAVTLPAVVSVDRPPEGCGAGRSVYVDFPGANLSPKRHERFLQLKSALKNKQYQVFGIQPVPMENEYGLLNSREPALLARAAGLLDPEKVSYEMPYTALAAISMNVPVLYMKGGALDRMAAGDLKSGACCSLEEAASRLSQLEKGKTRLKKKLLHEQERFLKRRSKAAATTAWDAFLPMVQQRIEASRRELKRKLRIGVVMPNNYTGGVLDYGIRLVKCIQMGAEEAGDNVDIFFGYTDHPVYSEKNYFKPLEAIGVPTASFVWRAQNRLWLKNTVSMDGCQMKEYPDICYVMDSGSTYFEDADIIIIIADRCPGKFFGRKPIAVVAHDYIQRYVPEICSLEYENNFYDFQRKAETVFVTSRSAYEDAIQCGGVSRNKVELIPLMFDLLEPPQNSAGAPRKQSASRGKYFLWSTNPAKHKNHLRALRGLHTYYANGGTLLCYMTGANTDWFDLKTEGYDDEYVRQVREEIKKHNVLKKKIRILGELPKAQYISLLGKAQFVFHPGYADNGNGTAIDAACLGVPTISSDYPAMRFQSEQTGNRMHFFDPFDSDDIAEALLAAEKSAEEYAREVPSRDELRKHTVECTYQEMYRIVKRMAGD